MTRPAKMRTVKANLRLLMCLKLKLRSLRVRALRSLTQTHHLPKLMNLIPKVETMETLMAQVLRTKPAQVTTLRLGTNP